jgi:hypothetical protein
VSPLPISLRLVYQWPAFHRPEPETGDHGPTLEELVASPNEREKEMNAELCTTKDYVGIPTSVSVASGRSCREAFAGLGIMAALASLTVLSPGCGERGDEIGALEQALVSSPSDLSESEGPTGSSRMVENGDATTRARAGTALPAKDVGGQVVEATTACGRQSGNAGIRCATVRMCTACCLRIGSEDYCCSMCQGDSGPDCRYYPPVLAP